MKSGLEIKTPFSIEYGKAISQAAQNPCGQFYRQLKTLGKVFNVKSSGESFEENTIRYGIWESNFSGSSKPLWTIL
jgi:hypothetical protein